MRSGLFMPAQPVSSRWDAVRGHTGVADEPAPMQQRIGAGHGTGRQVVAQPGPRRQIRRKASGQSGKVKQHWFAAFLDGKAAKAGGVYPRGTEQLHGGTESVEVVGMLTEAEDDADFFISDGG